MRLNLLNGILDYNNKPLLDSNGKEITVQQVIYVALNSIIPNESFTTDTKIKCYELTNKCMLNREVDLTIEEISFILRRVDLTQTSPLIYGRMRELLSINAS